MLKTQLGSQYSPMFFLASLGAGGLAVSFFMYLMFMIPHPDTPIVTFNHIWPYYQQGELWQQALISTALLGIVFFAVIHLRLLAWNIKEYRAFKLTEAFKTLRSSNAEITLMAIPLTLAMTINVLFVIGAVFVPDLWSIKEYLFPFSLLGFLVIGIYALRILGEYFTRLFITADFDFTKNNSLAPMVSIFALAMIAVGLAAPAAMSDQAGLVALSIFVSIFFAMLAVLLLVLKLVVGFNDMLRHGVRIEAAGSLWIIIPIMTILGITYVRLSHGIAHHFTAASEPISYFLLISALLSIQIIFGLIGYAVMKQLNYFRDFVRGDKAGAPAFALICPGVAMFVFGMFFVHLGLVATQITPIFSPVYFVILLPFIMIQLKTIQVFFGLNKRVLQAA